MLTEQEKRTKNAIRCARFRARHQNDPVYREKRRAEGRARYQRIKHTRKFKRRTKDQRKRQAQREHEQYLLRKNDPLWLATRKQKKSAYNRQARLDALMAYGGLRCVCPGCNETRYEFLCLDHIDGGGREQRRKIGIGANFFVWLRKQKYPPGLRVLCHNCNMSRGFYGFCPHEREQVLKASA